MLEVFAIPRARMPVVKFVHPDTGELPEHVVTLPGTLGKLGVRACLQCSAVSCSIGQYVR
jgi:hypothetical protein